MTMYRCPNCNSTSLAIEVKTWMNFDDGEPSEFDSDDLESAEPFDGSAAVCRECQHTGSISEFDPESGCKHEHGTRGGICEDCGKEV